MNGTTDLTGSSGEEKAMSVTYGGATSSDWGNPNDHFSSTDVTVTVTSNEPTASIANTKLNPAEGQTVDVTLVNGTFKSDVTASAFHLLDAGSSDTEVTGKISAVTVGEDGKARLTIDMTGLSSTYKIKVDNTAYTATTGTETELTTAANISVKASIAGSVSVSGTEKYGQELTAVTSSITGTPGTLSYQWYRNDGTTDTVITGATGSTYTLTKDDVGKTVKVKDSGADVYGSLEGATSGNVAAVTLTAPSTITGIPSVNKDATGDALQVTGTYTFVTADGLVGSDNVTVSYTATYSDVSTAGPVSDVTVVLGTTLGGDDEAAYTFAGATLSNQTGTVVDKGYALPATVTTSQGTADVTLNLGKAVLQAGESTTVTVGTLAEAEEITAITANNGTVTWTSGNSFTYTAPSTEPTSKESVTFTITTRFGNIQATAVVANKNYDGTTTATITEIKKTSDSSKITDTASDFASTTATFEDAEVGTGKTVTIGGTTEITVGGKTYTIAGTATANIEKAAAANATAKGAQVNKNATLQNVIDSIKAAPVMVDNITVAQGTVGDYFDDEAITDALKTAGVYTEAIEATVYDATETTTLATGSSTTAITSVVEGDTYTFTDVSTATFTVDGASKTADELVDVFEIDTANNTIKVVGDIADNTIVTVDTSTVIKFGTSVTVNAPVAESLNLGSQVAIELTFDVTTNATLADGSDTMLKKNFENMQNKKLNVTVPVKKSSGSSAEYITFNTNGLATASITEAEIEDGKVTELPTVTNVVKGVVFKGWSTDGTAAHIIDIDTYSSAEDGDELIAVFEGYMTGNGKGIVRPGANVTRAEFAKMLVIAAGIYDSSVDYGTSSFSDFDAATSWAIPYVACAEKAGIINGYETATGTVFKPSAAITREEAAKMIAKAFEVITTEGATTDKVTDFASVGDWAKEFVAALCENGTINGYESEDGYVFKAKSPIRRCEAAKMINCYIGLDDTDRASITADTTIVNPFTDITGNTKWAYADLMFASLSVNSSYYVTEITMPTID